MTEEATLKQVSDVEFGTRLRTGSILMALGGLAFIGYGIVFLIRAFIGSGFELGVATINGVIKAELVAIEPGIVHYITHLHVAIAGLLIAVGLAIAGLSWYGVRRGERWAWVTAVAAAVVSLGIALPMHYFELFEHDWVTHLGPVYLATIIFVLGAMVALRNLRPVDQSAALEELSE